MVIKTSRSPVLLKRLKLRAKAWPRLETYDLWDRQTSNGWLSIPRVFPLILRVINILAPKGKPLSDTYLELWCRTSDDSFVIASNPREMAFYSGFSGERAETTWRSRVILLQELGFIDIKGTIVNPIHYVLIHNPYLVIKRHFEEGKLSEDIYQTLQQRLFEVGAEDLEDEPDEPEAPPSIDLNELMRKQVRIQKKRKK